MIKPLAISLIIIALACSNGIAQDITMTANKYDKSGKLIEIFETRFTLKDVQYKADDDIRSTVGDWPAWYVKDDTGVYCTEYPAIETSCLSCHRPDRTRRYKR